MSIVVKITPNATGNPAGKLADAELHFLDGELDGLKLIGFGVWERCGGAGRSSPSRPRQYSPTANVVASRCFVRRGALVHYQDNGSPLTEKTVQTLALRAAGRAKRRNSGPHIFRHTICSHLAMRCAPFRAIQELTGHQDLSTLQRYMHLSPAAIEGAIRLLDRPASVQKFGRHCETTEEAIDKLRG